MDFKRKKKLGNMAHKKIKTVKGLVEQLRSVSDQINTNLENMTAEQRTEYFKQMRERHTTK